LETSLSRRSITRSTAGEQKAAEGRRREREEDIAKKRAESRCCLLDVLTPQQQAELQAAADAQADPASLPRKPGR